MLKRLKKSLSLTLVLALCMSFIACGSDGKSDDNFSDDSDSFEGRVKDSEQIAAQDNPNEGLGGGLNEDAVNDFSEFEGIWLGEANNEYDSMEIDSEGNWTLFLSGEVVAISAMSRSGKLSMHIVTWMIPVAVLP